MSILVMVALFVVAVVMQALFAGYETGFVSANPIRIRYLAEEERLPWAARLLRYIYKPDRMLTTLLLGTNMCVVMGTLAITDILGATAAMLIAAPVFLVLSEIVPKSVFRTHPNRLSLALLPVIEVFYVLLAPLAIPISALIRFLLRAVGRKDTPLSPFMSSLEDVRILVDEGTAHGTIEREEQRMIHSVIDLQTTQASEIMVPRIDILALPDTATHADLLAVFVESERTRIPVYRGSIDKIVGIINVYDVLVDTATEDETIARFIRPVMHVPDSMKVDELLKSLKDAKQHMAIVIDEYGGTDGLITLEDILEEIFGEIQDEHDHEESPIYQVGPRAYVVDARTSLEEVSKVIGLPIEDEEVETVGGWVMHVTGRIPAQGEVIMHGPIQITILGGSAHCLIRVRLDIAPDAKRTGPSRE